MHRIYRLLILVSFGLLLASCNADNEATPENEILSLSGENEIAPSLMAGDYEAAACFRAGTTSQFTDWEIYEVEIYVRQAPDYASVKIYDAGTITAPGTLLTEQVVSISPNSWINITLDQPVTLNGDDIWVAVAFGHTFVSASMGCDPGPAVTDGQWFYDDATQSWSVINININWNIRAKIRQR